MPTTRDPLAAYTIAESIRECITQELDSLTLSQGQPGRNCVIAGDIAWDDCECGQLTVAITDSYYTSTFPEPSPATAGRGSQSRCGPPYLAIQYRIVMLRCAPTGGEDPKPPTCEALDLAARIATEDAAAVRRGVFCCLRNLNDTRDPATNGKMIEDFRIGQQMMVGPEGFCQGSALPVTVGIVNACPCHDWTAPGA